MIIKIVYGSQIHLYSGPHTLSAVQHHCQQVFKRLPDFYDFFYVDEDADSITLNSDPDFIAFSEIYREKRIKKIFVREIEDALEEDISEEGFLQLQVEQAQIKTINLGEEQMMIRDIVSVNIEEMNRKVAEFSMEQEKMMKELVDSAMEEMNQKVIEDYGEEEKIIKNLVSSTIEQINESILNKWKIEEEQAMEEQVAIYMQTLTNYCLQISQPSKKQVQIQTDNEEMVDLDEVVQAKVRTMVPDIMRKAQKMIQGKYGVFECPYCQNSQMERLINRQLLRKLKKRKVE